MKIILIVGLFLIAGCESEKIQGLRCYFYLNAGDARGIIGDITPEEASTVLKKIKDGTRYKWVRYYKINLTSHTVTYSDTKQNVIKKVPTEEGPNKIIWEEEDRQVTTLYRKNLALHWVDYKLGHLYEVGDNYFLCEIIPAKEIERLWVNQEDYEGNQL